jgi:hypothetical protein
MAAEDKMTPAIQRVLCGLIGECWHEKCTGEMDGDEILFRCVQCDTYFYKIEDKRRSFTTPADAHRVMKALVEKGLYSDFYNYVLDYDHGQCGVDNFDIWLHSDPERFCVLAGTCPAVAEAVKKGK